VKLTDPEVIEHLKENYYVRREKWDKDTGIYHDTQSFWLRCAFMEMKGLRITMEDLEADDWVLCPKE
jgi:hypothetical protein